MLKRFKQNTRGRDWIVGDIHGHFNKLQQQLDEAGFNPEQGDRLFSVGDLVDRGPDSEQVIEWITRPWFHAVQGNHDDMAIRWPEGSMVDGVFVRNMPLGNYIGNGGAWNIANPPELQREIAECLACLPVAIELETAQGVVGIVHAECPMDSWAEFAELLNTSTLPKTLKSALIDAAMWSRQRHDYLDCTVVQDVRAVVVGHNPVSQVLVLGNTIHIDTMGWMRKPFTFLDVETLEAVVMPREMEAANG